MVDALPECKDDALLTTAQLAAALRCHRNTILFWTKKGLLLPKFHTRGKKLFKWKEVKTFFYAIF